MQTILSFFLCVFFHPVTAINTKHPMNAMQKVLSARERKKTHNNLEDVLRATQIPALCNTALKCYSPCLHSSDLHGRKNGEMEGRLCM